MVADQSCVTYALTRLHHLDTMIVTRPKREDSTHMFAKAHVSSGLPAAL